MIFAAVLLGVAVTGGMVFVGLTVWTVKSAFTPREPAESLATLPRREAGRDDV